MMNKKEKALTEKKTRDKLIADAYRTYGPESAKQLRMMLDQWDVRIKNCKNEQERSHMKKVAIAEVYQLMGYIGGLSINHQVVIPDERKFK
jgi:hypothetical protein